MAEWKTVSLASLGTAFATGPFGSAVSAKNFRDTGIPMIRGSNLSEHVGVRLEETDLAFVDDDLAASFNRCIVTVDDLVFTCWGTVGQIGFIDRASNHGRYLISNKQMKMTPDKNMVEPIFLYYYLSQSRMISLVKGQAIGSSVPGFNLGQLKNLSIQLPAIGEQRAIAEVLGALDNKIDTNSHISSKSLELARLYYKRSVSGKGRNPMASVLEPTLGGTPPRNDESMWGGNAAWTSAKDIANAPHQVVVSTSETISDLAAAKKRTSPLPAGTVVLTARGTVGVVARLGIASAINQSCYGFVPDLIPPSCLFFAIEDAADQARSMAHGSVFDTITMNTFDHVQIPDLSQSEWYCVEATLAPMLAISQQKLVEANTLEETRDSLLPLLMSGKVRVRDAEKVVEEVV